MPLFDYQCPACGTDFEVLVRGATKVACPSCGSARVRKLLSVPARPASAAPSPAPACDAGPSGGCCGGMCQPN